LRSFPKDKALGYKPWQGLHDDGFDESEIKYVYPLPRADLRIDSSDPSYKKHIFTKEEVEGGLVRVVGPFVTALWMGKPKKGI
jgi:hypothetical protein